MKIMHRWSYQWQRVALIVFWIAFIIYIPIGIAIACEWKRLPIDKVRCNLPIENFNEIEK